MLDRLLPYHAYTYLPTISCTVNENVTVQLLDGSMKFCSRLDVGNASFMEMAQAIVPQHPVSRPPGGAVHQRRRRP